MNDDKDNSDPEIGVIDNDNYETEVREPDTHGINSPMGNFDSLVAL